MNKNPGFLIPGILYAVWSPQKLRYGVFGLHDSGARRGECMDARDQKVPDRAAFRTKWWRRRVFVIDCNALKLLMIKSAEISLCTPLTNTFLSIYSF
jgi:hypothetical protein